MSQIVEFVRNFYFLNRNPMSPQVLSLLFENFIQLQFVQYQKDTENDI